MAKRILTTAQETQFKEWVEDGNVAKIDDNTYLEQTTQWTKKFTLDELKTFFKREYLSNDNAGIDNDTEHTFKDKKFDITYTVRKSPTRSDRWEIVSSSPNWQSDDIEMYVSEEDALEIAKIKAGIKKEDDPEAFYMGNIDKFSDGGSALRNFVITATGISKQNKEHLINMGVQLNFQGVGYYLYVKGEDKDKVLEYLRKNNIDFTPHYKGGGAIGKDLTIQRRDLLNELVNNGVIDEEHFYFDDVNSAISSNNAEQMREVIEELILSDIIDKEDWNYSLAKKLSRKQKFSDGGSIMKKTMNEFKQHKLHSSSGDIVTNPKQAVAIGLSKERRGKFENGGGVDNSIVKTEYMGYSLETSIQPSGATTTIASKNKDYIFGTFSTALEEKTSVEKMQEKIRSQKFGNGGSIEEQNYAMAQNDNKAIMHHSKELNEVLKTKRVIPAWALALINQSSQNLSNVTHYLDGAKQFAKGGVSKKIYGDNVTFIDAIGNEQVGMVQDMDDKGIEVFYEERFMRVPTHRIVKFH